MHALAVPEDGFLQEGCVSSAMLGRDTPQVFVVIVAHLCLIVNGAAVGSFGRVSPSLVL